MSKVKLMQIEAMIDDLYDRDPNDPRIHILEAQADELAEELNKIQERTEAQLKEEELKRKERKAAIVADIIQLNKDSKWDEMIAKYGGEFIDNYEIQGNSVLSFAKGEVNTWEVDDPEKKLRQLLVWRIYDHYVR